MMTLNILILLVIVLLMASLMVARGGNPTSLQLEEAAKRTAADIRAVRQHNMRHPDEPWVFIMIDDARMYYVAALSDITMPLLRPERKNPWMVTYSRRAEHDLPDVRLERFDFGPDFNRQILFNSAGVPMLERDGRIVLRAHDRTVTITVEHKTGDIHVGAVH